MQLPTRSWQEAAQPDSVISSCRSAISQTTFGQTEGNERPAGNLQSAVYRLANQSRASDGTPATLNLAAETGRECEHAFVSTSCRWGKNGATGSAGCRQACAGSGACSQTRRPRTPTDLVIGDEPLGSPNCPTNKADLPYQPLARDQAKFTSIVIILHYNRRGLAYDTGRDEGNERSLCHQCYFEALPSSIADSKKLSAACRMDSA